MQVVFHPLVAGDVRRALSRYDEAGGKELGDAFYAELMSRIQQAIANPRRFHFADGDIRRANLRRFPYHILYREVLSGIRVLVVKHNRQNPTFGMRRK